MDNFNFPNYKILRLIGEGSFGKVFKAEDETKNVVALKVLRKRSNKETKPLKQEADIHQNLRHPNIIQLLSFFETEKELVFVCEYAISDLQKLLARKVTFSEKRTRKISFDLISALYYLHDHRILHRDLKPPNILLDENLKAKLCDFGLARNMSPGTQVVTSIKGTPLYMAPEVLEDRGYGYKADLWSLGCIIFEMLKGETPFCASSLCQLLQLIKFIKPIYPSFISKTCRNFLQRLLVINPQDRMTWSEIEEHEFVKGHILIFKSDQVSDSPFTKPIVTCDKYLNDKAQQAASIDKIRQLKNRGHGAIEDVNVVSSRDSIKVNLNLQSDMEPETDNEEFLMLRNESDESETSGDRSDQFDEDYELLDQKRPSVIQMLPEQFHNFQQFQREAPRIHKIANYQPVAENPNMVMHRFLDNVDPEMQNFMLTPAMMMAQQFPMVPPDHTESKLAQDLPNDSHMEKQMDPRKASLTKSNKTQSDGISTDDSCVPVETEEWLQFLFKTMQEILDGDLEIYKQDDMMKMIVGLLRNPKFNSKLMDYVVQIICLPYAIDMPQAILDDIDKLYLQMKLVPNLVYASKLLCSKKLHNSMDKMSIPKIDEIIHFNQTKLKTLSNIYDLLVYLVNSGGTFIHQLCDAISLLDVDNLFRSFLMNETGDSNESERLTASIVALMCAFLQGIPEKANLIERLIFHDDVDLSALLRHKNAKVRLRTCLLLRLLGRFCCFSLQNQWNHQLSDCLEKLTEDEDEEVKNAAMNIIEEFKECLGWSKI